MARLNFKVVKFQKAPVNLNRRSGRSEWRDLFEAMEIGHWFEIDRSDYARTANAASKYMRGRYSLYQHPTKIATYVCVKNK
jgi:hypothetical protein